jgi:hypothetical protein
MPLELLLSVPLVHSPDTKEQSFMQSMVPEHRKRSKLTWLLKVGMARPSIIHQKRSMFAPRDPRAAESPLLRALLVWRDWEQPPVQPEVATIEEAAEDVTIAMTAMTPDDLIDDLDPVAAMVPQSFNRLPRQLSSPEPPKPFECAKSPEVGAEQRASVSSPQPLVLVV